MSRRALFILGCALLLGGGLLVIYLLQQLQPYDKLVNHGPAPEARANPYLAAELFLRQQKLQVQRADGLDELKTLPSAGRTLLLLGSRNRMTPGQSKRVLEWTAQGGHLIFVAEEIWDEDKQRSGDLLLDQLGIQQLLSEDLDQQDDSESAEDAEDAEDAQQVVPRQRLRKPARSPEHDYPQLTKLYLENEKAPAYLDFDTDFHLYDSQNRAHAWANSDGATHMLQLSHGDGLVTVLTDAWLWQNDEIGEYDHAWLLWYLTQDTAVTLLYRADRDDLLSLLLRNFPLALATLALLILFGLWHVGLRHGPLAEVVSRSRRQLEEHLRASAAFLLRHHGQAHLLQGLQRDIQRRARRRHPGFERLPVAEQWRVLGQLTRLPASAVAKAMRPAQPTQRSASEFTRQVAHLQTLRNAL